MTIKFPYSEDFKERLKTYCGKVNRICYPLPNSNEKFCYARLLEHEKDEFVKHFVDDASTIIALHDDTEEMPDVYTSKNYSLFKCESIGGD